MNRIFAVASAVALSYAAIGPAQALSSKECSTKYQAAKQAGTLNGQKWNDFRKAECGSSAEATTTTVPNPLSPTPSKAAAPAAAQAPAAKVVPPSAAPRPAPSAATGSAVFPQTVAPKFASESAGKGRMHTCLDQYNANKAAGGSGNGGLNWTQKGGGYYSECNKRLKM